MNTQTPLLILSMSHYFDWERGLVNRNYHIVRALAAMSPYRPIIVVDFFPFTVKKKIKVLTKGVRRKKTRRTIYSSFTARIQQDEMYEHLYFVSALSQKQIPTLLEKIGVKTESLTIWSYNPMATDVINQFPQAFFIFDAVDNWIEHPSYQKYTVRLEKAYKDIRSRADIIFTVSEGLIDFFEKRENAYFIPNAVDADFFAESKENRSLLPKGVDESLPIVGYHGVIQSRVNFTILDYVTEQLPDVQFVLVGPVWKEVQKDLDHLTSRKNVFHRGMISYIELPSLIANFDVTIIPHKVDQLTQSMNPLKIYEYLAAGKPIIATAVPGADQFQDLVKLAVSPDDFAMKIRKALAVDSAEFITRRQNMAQQHTWNARLQVMLDTIDRVKQEKKVK